MGILSSAYNKTVGRFLKAGYEAVERSKQRKKTKRDNRSEDRVLDSLTRDELVSACRDLRRNHSIVESAVRKHVNYVARFKFQCNGTNADFNAKAEELMDWWSRPLNCDVTGRHGLYQLIELIEGHAVTDGDVFVLKINDGRIQIIEGDRIRTPVEFGDLSFLFDQTEFVFGVKVGPFGGADVYTICQRIETNSGFSGWKLAQTVSAGDMYQHGYFDRADQIRGIPLLAPAINDFKDLHDAKRYALAKMKVSQFAAMARFLNASEEEEEGTTSDISPVNDGPQVFDMQIGEDVKVLESQQPSDQFQGFIQVVKMDALKCLDQPYSFHDEKWTNYSGARNALQQYDQLANSHRDRLRLLLNALTAWRMQMFIDAGELEVPEGLSLADLKWEWVSQGMPWIDPKNERESDVLSIQQLLDSHENVCRRRGQDWYKIMDQLSDEKAYIAEKGFTQQEADDAATGFYPQIQEEQKSEEGRPANE